MAIVTVNDRCSAMLASGGAGGKSLVSGDGERCGPMLPYSAGVDTGLLALPVAGSEVASEYEGVCIYLVLHRSQWLVH
jgi:hypothetical protein